MTEDRIQVGMSQEYLETSKLTNAAGQEVHREGTFTGDPLDVNAKGTVKNSTPGASDYGPVVRPILADPLPITEDMNFYTAVAAGLIPGASVVHKFGKNDAVGTSYEPVCLGGIYRMPQVSGATALRVKAGNANDDASGTGARSVTLEGLDETGTETIETIATAGASAGANSSATFIRLYRTYIETSGTYPTAIGTNSQAADVVIENAAGTEDWITVPLLGGQSRAAAYTVPLGKTAYVNGWFTTVDGNKDHDIIAYYRQNILETAAPYSALRSNLDVVGLIQPWDPIIKIPSGPFPALTDMVWAAKVDSGTAEISVDFEILLIDD